MTTTIPRILVPVDHPQFAASALPVAAELAHRLGAEVSLLRVINPPPAASAGPRGDLAPLVDAAERQADTELRACEMAFAGLPVSRVILVGDRPAKEIIDWLQVHPTTLVVMAARRRGRLQRRFRPSVTEAVLRSEAAPVVVVGPRRAPLAIADPARVADTGSRAWPGRRACASPRSRKQRRVSNTQSAR